MVQSYLRRYTDITSLVGALTRKELPLLDPSSWDDKNDSYFIQQYKEKLRRKTVLALCFTQATETYHHWRVFSDGPAGVCIWFKEAELRAHASRVPNLRVEPVEYLTIESIRKASVSTQNLPFVKRFPFKPEQEIRMLWESDTETRTSIGVPFDTSTIARVTLSPWLHQTLADPVKALLKSIPDCSSIRVYRSTLVGNDEWKKRGREAT